MNNTMGMWLKFAIQNTLRNRRRSLVTVSIAALGTAAILLAGGFALSTYQALAQAAARSSGHLILGTPAKIAFNGLISNGDKSTIMMATGVEPDSEFGVKGPFLTMTAGQVLASGSTDAEVMLGAGLARSLKATPGSSLTLLTSTTEGAMNAMDVRVKGIFSTGVPDIDKRLVYTDIVTAQKLLVTQRVSSLGIFLDRMESTEPVQQRLAAQFPQLTVQTWMDQAFFYKSVRDLYNRIFGALGFIIGVTLIIPIGGADMPGQLLRTLALEGMVLGGVGAVTGAALSLGLSLMLYVVPVNMPAPPGRSEGYPLTIAIDPTMYIATLATMVLLTMLASSWVARKTVNMAVVDALAHT